MKPWKVREQYLGEVVRPPSARTASSGNPFVPLVGRWALDAENKRKRELQKRMETAVSGAIHYDF